MSLIRRSFLALAAALVLAVPAAQAADQIGAAEITLGSPDAKVKVIEYASVTCPHCAQFHNEVFAAFKAKYIDTGLVQLSFREFPTEPANVAVAGFMTARCAGPTRYFDVLSSLFAGQAAMYEARSASTWLTNAAKVGGLDEAALVACLEDEAAVDGMAERYKRYIEVEMIRGTPTFVIGDDQPHFHTMADIDAAIQPLLK